MLKQSLSQRLLQKLSPQQIQFIKLLQLTTVDFEQKLEEELLENPSLEKGPEEELPGEKSTDDFNNEESLNDDFNDEEKVFDNDDFNVNEFLTGDEDNATFRLNEDYGSEEERKEMPVAYQQTFYDSLVDQANSNFRDKNLVLALHIIGNLEEDGYLRRDLTMIANDLAFTENIQTDEDELEKILIKIQNFDPVGVGARSLQECLLLQLYKKDLGGNKSLDLAELIISEHMEAFSRKHYDKIKSSLKINDEELKSAVAEITKLNPKPGQSQSSSRSHYITPDFTVTNEDDNLTVTLNSRNAPELRISRSFVETLQAYEKSNKDDKKLNESVQYIRQKLDGAKWFIDSVKQRQHTLTVTMNAIVEFQRKFFLEGDEYSLKPMILKDVSDKVQLDISTISRVANSKYVQTDFGIFPLKFFFSEGVKNENGEEVSNKEVKKILSDAVLNESKVKPLTDEALMDMLKEKGFSMARRTVAKYREQLNIPVARMR
ncbi:MAG: RNA polymerase factor sigma-54, partial [Bacteroidia bacterium]|nr:RNA polymerase factor sigma-54 [Bacteroidia bacterium]